jgi:hypothetical protein
LVALVAVVAVVVTAAVILLKNRPSGVRAEAEAPAEVPPAAPEAVAPPAEQAPAVKEREVKAPEPVSEAAAEPVAKKPEPSEKELKQHVESRLEESERLLRELRDVAGRDSELASPAMVEIMAEGLGEVRTLAKARKWSHARDKGDALHAQLTMMLQKARRERAS